MLSLLHIENIAVIESADITFEKGFNALTGETGAGKSIVIDAIGAVIMFSRDPKVKMGDMELKLALTAANFLGRQMEQ